jgi:SAM-dependent methyltransferase
LFPNVPTEQPAPDTAVRSLAHWSEAGRREMEAFYALARLDYELLAAVLDWRALLGGMQAGRDTPLRLLDVACGSGKFPETLVARAGLGDLAPIEYDLLDPSAFSLAEAAAVLRPPFTENARFESTLEDLPLVAGPWDVVWATHALYALDPDKVVAAVARYVWATARGGFSFLAQGARGGHYLDVYAAFLEGVRGGEGTPYVSSDDLIAEFRAAGAEPDVRRIAYDHVIADGDTAVLEGYLQRCLFDDTIGLEQMLEAPVLGGYLAGCHDTDAGLYRFHQEVDCVVLSSFEGAVPWTAAS